MDTNLLTRSLYAVAILRADGVMLWTETTTLISGLKYGITQAQLGEPKCEKILSDEREVKKVIKKELRGIKKDFGKDRKTIL